MQEQHSSQIEKNSCSICTQRQQNALLDECQHRFCLKCIRKWSKKKNTCPLCRQTFQAIKSNGRAYKVDPPKPILRPSQDHNRPRPQIIQRRIIFVPIFYNAQMNMNNWLSSYNFPQIQPFNPTMSDGPANQTQATGFSWMQPSFYLPFSNQ